MIISKPSPKQDSNTERIKNLSSFRLTMKGRVLFLLGLVIFLFPLLSLSSQEGDRNGKTPEQTRLIKLEKEIGNLHSELLPLYENGDNTEVIARSEKIKQYDPFMQSLLQGHELSQPGEPTPGASIEASGSAGGVPEILTKAVTEQWLDIHWMRAQSYYRENELSQAVDGFEKNFLYRFHPSAYVFVDYAACLGLLDKSEDGKRVLLAAFTRLPVWDWYNIYWELGWNAYVAENDRECLLYSSRAAYLNRNAAGPKYIAALSCFADGKAEAGFSWAFAGLAGSLRSDEDNNRSINASVIEELYYLGENFSLDDRTYSAVQTALWFLLLQEGRFDELDGPSAYADPAFLQFAFRYVDGNISGLLMLNLVQALGVFRDLEALPLILDQYVYTAIKEKNFSAYWNLLRMDEEYYQEIHNSQRFTLIERGKGILEIAISRYWKAEEMWRKGDFLSALEAMEEALEQCRRIGYGESLFGVRIRMALGEMSVQLGQVQDAGDYYRSCLDIMSALPGGRSLPWYRQVLDNFSFVLAQKGLYREALAVQEERRELSAALEPQGNHPLYLDVLNSMAILATVGGDTDRAEDLWLESLELAEEVPPRRLGKLYTRNAEQLALYYTGRGDFASADTYITQVLRGYEAIPYRASGEAYASALRAAGIITFSMGKYDQAESYYRRALDVYAELEPKGEHNDYAYTFSALGELYLTMGRMNQAEKVLLRAASILRETPADPMMYLPSLLAQLAGLYSTLGEYYPAVDLLEEAAQVFMAKPQFINTAEFAVIFKQLASIYTDMGLYEDALEAIRKAKALYAELSPRGKHIFYVHALRTEALLLRYLGKEEEALTLYEDILSVTGDFPVQGKNPLYSQTLTGAGLINELSGNYDKAEEYYLKALAIQKNYAPQGRHPDYKDTLYHIARFYDARNEPEKAAPYYLEEQRIRGEYISTVFPVLSEKEKGDYYFTMKGPLESFFSFCERGWEEDPGLIGEALNAVLLTKGILLHSVQKMRRDIVSSGDTELQGKLNRWLTVKGEIAELLSGFDEGGGASLQSKLVRQQAPGGGFPGADNASEGGPGSGAGNGAAAGSGGAAGGAASAGGEGRISTLEEEANELERFLSQRSRLFAETYRVPDPDWKELRKLLSPGEAAVEMVRYRFYAGGWTEEIHYAVFIITPETEVPRVVILQDGSKIETDLVKEYRRYIKNSTRKLLPWEEDPGKTLYTPLWEKVDRALGEAQRVFYVPDGVYNVININTLKNEEGDFLFATRSYDRLTSLKDLLRDGSPEKTGLGDSGEAVLFGFPDYLAPYNGMVEKGETGAGMETAGTTDQAAPVLAERDISGEVLTPLPGTGREVQSIGSILKEGGKPVRIYLQEKAREEAVKELVRPGILHIATHGFFITQMEDGPEEDYYFKLQRRSAEPRENPLIRSGLMMASAGTSLSTQSVPADGEDGILTAMEAINLPLEGTDLVTLSACETGLGEIKHGEGVYGLQRAFLAAGAEAVLMSLWKVSDEETATFMIDLYRRLAQGLPVRQAYRETLREMQKRFPAPFHWGAFVLLETEKGL